MDSEQGSSSNHENKTSIKEEANSSLSFCVEKTEEILSKVRSAFAGCTNPAQVLTLASQSREIESLFSEVLNSLGKTRVVINTLTGETNASSVQQNQAVEVALPAPPPTPSITPQTQAEAALPGNQAPLLRFNIPQQKQAGLPSNRVNATSVQQNQAAALALTQQSQAAPPPRSSITPQNQAAFPFNRTAFPQFNIPQQNNAALPSNRGNTTSVQQNQAAALSVFQQNQVASRLDIIPKNQDSLLSNRVAVLPLSNIPKENQAARPYLPQNQARVHSFNLLSSPMTNAGVSFHFQQSKASFASIIHSQKNSVITPSLSQQNQDAVHSSSRIGSQYEAVPPTIPQGQQTFQQSLQQVLNPGTNVGSTSSETSTKKRRSEELYSRINELPEIFNHLESHLIKRILAEIVDQDAIVKWDDIAGLEHAKNCVHETVLWPVLNPRIFQGVRSIGKGILLFGPPGTGKTMIGKAIAGEMKATFFNISASSLTSKWLGEGEKLVRALFALALQLQPSVIFFDEIDAILFRRSSSSEHEAFRRIKTQLLVEMEGIDSGSDQIIVIGATNRPQDLDEAARRRLSKRLYVPLPCPKARLYIVVHTMEKSGRYVLSEQELDLICNLTDGYSGSDMKNLVKEAMMGPIRDAIRDVKNGKDIRELEPEDLRPVALQDFENALKEVRPSVSRQELAGYVEWNAKFGSMSF